jgi:hypothetical protein
MITDTYNDKIKNKSRFKYSYHPTYHRVVVICTGIVKRIQL